MSNSAQSFTLLSCVLPAGVGLPAYQPEKIGPELEKQTILITHKYFL